ncbi:MAG: hypothetical protein IJS97_07940 [Prevotella sp.]|nr:hypothetical protein [Prevotella sp.]
MRKSISPTEDRGPVELRFATAPGAKRLHVNIAGKVRDIMLPQALPQGGEYVLCVKPDKGQPAVSLVTEPIRIDCEKGLMRAGDWSDYGALKYYSGGIRYTKDVLLDSPGKKTVLDLGEVDATCEVSVNGCEPQVLIDPPYRLDITPYAHNGKNTISVLVYSSLANHYQTTPSPYRGEPHAGLIGPVTITK